MLSVAKKAKKMNVWKVFIENFGLENLLFQGTIILSTLIRTPIPASTFIFFQGCMTFAQIDIFDGQNYYDEWFNFAETSPHSDMFEMMDIGDKNFVMNSGSYFIFGGGLVIYFVSRWVLNTMARCCAKSARMRKLGIYSYESSYIGNFWMASLKLYIESYFDLVMCSLLACLAWLEIRLEQSFAS